MKKYIILLPLVLICCQNIKGQSNNIVASSFSITNEIYPLNAKINSMIIYEQYTEVEFRFTNKQSSNLLRISSKSYITNYNNSNDVYPILAYKGNALDQIYNMGKKDDMNYINLVFDRLPPGMQKINIILNPEDSAPWVWKGVTITNPDNHPKTSWTEPTLKNDWDKNGLTPIEGIYEATSGTVSAAKYKVAVKKIDSNYQLIYLSGAAGSTWKTGQIKGYLTETATPLLFKTKWFMANKAPFENCYTTFEPGFMKVLFNQPNNQSLEDLYLKLYPTASDENSNGRGRGSGSGFALTSNGLIATNNHVIDGANNIVVRGINGIFDKAYDAKLVLTDKNNDVAIIKIEDPNFSGLGNIPYVIKTKVSEVGESVFLLGYPLMASMGKEIKLTNGIISSRTGYQGDVTTYQISAPAQPGNSGGPLFDNNGDIVGVLNSKHTEAENASYAVKTVYLKNLIDLLDNPPLLQTTSSLKGKSLAQQADIVKKFVYIIEIQ